MPDMLSFTDPSYLNDPSADDLLPLDLDLDGLSPNQSHHAQPLNPNATSLNAGNVFNTDNNDTPRPQSPTILPSKEEPQDDAQNVDSDIPMSGVGAGPLPTGFGVQLPPNVGSTLTEFTKRRNWSQRVVEELRDFLHILTPDGRIIYVSPSTKALTGHEPPDLIGRFIVEFIHSDDKGMYTREFHESIASGNPLRFYYRFLKPDGSWVIFECHGHPHFSSEQAPGYDGHGVSFCRGFFMMARPYPSRNAALLDSFLEHKIENERLKRRIHELRREEHEELQQLAQASQIGQLTVPGPSAAIPGSPRDPSQGRRASFGSTDRQQQQPVNRPAAVPASPSKFNGMPPPAKPSASSTALTSHNLSEALAASRPDSINDKMARYEGAANHLESIEMFTGLRYREGERSKGISTGSASPMLVRGDQGIEIPVDSEGRAIRTSGSPANGGSGPDSEREREKRRKMKVADEYVCTDCGTLDSPEWRRGPNGPKTLCNACGLRWAKKEKKRSEHHGSGGPGAGGSGSGGTVGGGAAGANGSTGVINPTGNGPGQSGNNIGPNSSTPQQTSPNHPTCINTQASQAMSGNITQQPPTASPIHTPSSATFNNTNPSLNTNLSSQLNFDPQSAPGQSPTGMPGMPFAQMPMGMQAMGGMTPMGGGGPMAPQFTSGNAAAMMGMAGPPQEQVGQQGGAAGPGPGGSGRL